MKQMLKKYHATYFIQTIWTTFFLLSSVALFSQNFILPVEGKLQKDIFIVNYVDWDTAGIKDAWCNHKTYDGHQGTDFVIRNFAQMDSGVSVLAAGPGIVTYVVDTFFDRNKTAVNGGFGNFVCIKHPSKYYTYYAHLKKNSALVKPGDTVVAGTKLGFVGSSGYSSDPHLHFEVWYDSLYNVDPFQGPCGNASTLWKDSIPYIHSFGVIDHALTNFNPTLDTLKERLPSKKYFTTTDQFITYWLQCYGVYPGDVSTIRWYNPSQILWYEYQFTHPEEWWYYYMWTYIDVPPLAEAGQWEVTYSVNEEIKQRDTFFVHTTTAIKDMHAGDLAHIIYKFTDNILLLTFSHLIQEAEVQVFNAIGTCVSKRRVSNQNEFELSAASFSQGIYFIRFSERGKEYCLKVLKI